MYCVYIEQFLDKSFRVLLLFLSGPFCLYFISTVLLVLRNIMTILHGEGFEMGLFPSLISESLLLESVLPASIVKLTQLFKTWKWVAVELKIILKHEFTVVKLFEPDCKGRTINHNCTFRSSVSWVFTIIKFSLRKHLQCDFFFKKNHPFGKQKWWEV